MLEEIGASKVWPLEGSLKCNQQVSVRSLWTDTVAARAALVSALATDSQFTIPLLQLAALMLAAEGAVVIGAPTRRSQPPQSRTAFAMAARYFQIYVDEKGACRSICAPNAVIFDCACVPGMT